MPSSVLVVSALGAFVAGVAVGLCLVKTRRKKRQMRQKEPCVWSDTESRSEAIFFPDGGLDLKMSKDQRGLAYRGILSSSRPLRRLLQHLSAATETIDLALYLITSQDLANAVLAKVCTPL